jgi:hypothetical protein
MKEKHFDQGRKQMRLEVTKENEEAARHILAGKRWGLWLKEIANPLLEDLQQQHPRQLAVTDELERFCRERLLMSQKRTL